MSEKNINNKLDNNRINILVTFDKNYINPFKVMLASLAINNPNEKFNVFLIHSAIPKEDLASLLKYCKSQRAEFSSIQVNRSDFEKAPVSKKYPQEMYYRLLAPILLPEDLDKILYIDPDILVINSIRPLWDIQLGKNTFAAASHGGVIKAIDLINKIRLKSNSEYFNTGVILMDLNKARQLVKSKDIFECVEKKNKKLIWPDQDVFNILYGSHTLSVPDNVWNYDARYFSIYLKMSDGVFNIDWVIENTVILHFCGKKKPWKANYYKKRNIQFSALYKHYIKLANR